MRNEVAFRAEIVDGTPDTELVRCLTIDVKTAIWTLKMWNTSFAAQPCELALQTCRQTLEKWLTSCLLIRLSTASDHHLRRHQDGGGAAADRPH